MKIAISVPDDVFAQVDAAAERLGITRSAFFTAAARRWLLALDDQTLTSQIDATLGPAAEDDNDAFLWKAARGTAKDDHPW